MYDWAGARRCVIVCVCNVLKTRDQLQCIVTIQAASVRLHEVALGQCSQQLQLNGLKWK